MFEKTEKMLSSLELTGSYARYNDRLNDVVQSRNKEYRLTAKKRESSVDVTALIRGKVKFGHIIMKDNFELLWQECFHLDIKNSYSWLETNSSSNSRARKTTLVGKQS